MSRRAYLLASAASGCVWAAIAWLIGHGPMGPIVLGGMLAAPAIGVAIGLLARPAHGWPRWARALLALFTLYLAAALFGAAAGLWDVTRPIQGRIPHRVVLQSIYGTLWGLTFTGYVLILWPLAIVNHGLLARLSRRPRGS